MLKSLFRKIAGLRERVQKGAKFDKLNLADDVRERSPLARSVVNRTARIMFQRVLRLDLTSLPEDFDVNQPSQLAAQEFLFTSKAKNPAANLISLEIIESDAEVIEVIDNHIKISTEDGVSDHDSIKALIEAYAPATALISVAINSGEGVTLVQAESMKYFSGAIG